MKISRRDLELLMLRCSSFQNTDLDYQLRQREITKLVFAGLVANTCLEATARHAFELYAVTHLFLLRFQADSVLSQLAAIVLRSCKWRRQTG